MNNPFILLINNEEKVIGIVEESNDIFCNVKIWKRIPEFYSTWNDNGEIVEEGLFIKTK